MKCEVVERNIDGYCAGYLPEDFALAMEKHLDTCPHCALTLLDNDASFDNLLTQVWYGDSPCSDFVEKVMTRVGARRPQFRAHLWLIPLCAFYMTIVGALGLWIFAGSKVQALLQPVSSIIRTTMVVVRTMGVVVSVIQLNELGAFLVFAFSLILFAGIGLLNKEVKQ